MVNHERPIEANKLCLKMQEGATVNRFAEKNKLMCTVFTLEIGLGGLANSPVTSLKNYMGHTGENQAVHVEYISTYSTVHMQYTQQNR